MIDEAAMVELREMAKEFDKGNGVYLDGKKLEPRDYHNFMTSETAFTISGIELWPSMTAGVLLQKVHIEKVK